MDDYQKTSLEFTGERVVEGKTPDHLWEDHVERYAFAAKYVKGKQILDIACGSGNGSHILKTLGAAYRITGVDLSSEAIASANSQHKTISTNFLRGSIENLMFPDDCFDVIVSFETIEHVKHYKQALDEIVRVLRPKGTLILSTPNRKISSPGKSIFDPPNNPFHVIEFTNNELLTLLSSQINVLEIYGQRKVSKIFTVAPLSSLFSRIFPEVYKSYYGTAKVEKANKLFEYRYIILLCQNKAT